MPSEPNWSKAISSTTVCTWFYALAILNAFFAVAGILSVVMSKRYAFSVIVPLLLSTTLGFTNAWFMFLVCNRGLKN